MKDTDAGLFVPQWQFQCDRCGKARERNVTILVGSENQAVGFLRNSGWKVSKTGQLTCPDCIALIDSFRGEL